MPGDQYTAYHTAKSWSATLRLNDANLDASLSSPYRPEAEAQFEAGAYGDQQPSYSTIPQSVADNCFADGGLWSAQNPTDPKPPR